MFTGLGGSACGGEVDDSSTDAPSTKKTLPQDVRLPLNLKPYHYNVELQAHLYSGPPEDFTFDGHVEVMHRP